MSERDEDRTGDDKPTPRREFAGFLLLDMIILPAIVVAVLGTYALGIWIYQTIAGFP